MRNRLGVPLVSPVGASYEDLSTAGSTEPAVVDTYSDLFDIKAVAGRPALWQSPEHGALAKF